MIAQTAAQVKARTTTARLLVLRDIEVIILADKRAAEKRADWTEVDRCDAEMQMIEQQVDALTNGRGF